MYIGLTFSLSGDTAIWRNIKYRVMSSTGQKIFLQKLVLVLILAAPTFTNSLKQVDAICVWPTDLIGIEV